MTIFGFFKAINNVFYKIFVEWTIKVSFGHCGKQSFVSQGFSCAGIRHVYLGDHCYIGDRCTILSTKADVLIGDNVILGPNVTIISGDHRTDIVGKNISEVGDDLKLPENDKNIVFKGDNWVGANATILKGVEIGEGAVIAAGSLVIKSIPPYSIVGGVPAKVLKMRFTPEEIAQHRELINKRSSK